MPAPRRNRASSAASLLALPILLKLAAAVCAAGAIRAISIGAAVAAVVPGVFRARGVVAKTGSGTSESAGSELPRLRQHDSAVAATVRGRRAFIAASSSVLGSIVPQHVVAAEPKITQKCAFDFQIGFDRSAPYRRLVIGLYGEEAPILTRNFYQAFTRSYPDDPEGKVDYKLSDVKAVIKNKAIVWADFQLGNVIRRKYTERKGGVPIDREEFLPLAREEDTTTSERNSLRHDIPGRVSMRAGGGTFDFTISPVANATWLDETNVVIGQVLEGFDIIEDINELPVKGGAVLEDSLGVLASLGGDIRADLARNKRLRPLKRARIWETEVLP